jgi:hypothetical protein
MYILRSSFHSSLQPFDATGACVSSLDIKTLELVHANKRHGRTLDRFSPLKLPSYTARNMGARLLVSETPDS